MIITCQDMDQLRNCLLEMIMYIDFDLRKVLLMWNMATWVREHSQSSSAIPDHLVNCAVCKEYYSANSFRVVDAGISDRPLALRKRFISNSKDQLGISSFLILALHLYWAFWHFICIGHILTFCP